ncbi:hypothetical protein JRI60_38290 [Archangium violaceum]|uniref:hypothetical protein n=1 Tax=Archangium violaceum TaxID=83451 RepID=UPI00194F2F86|nr:hypothetical protein [Archangium violaceum]QRN94911.1 hypothetical protein JRI60_38290 [Archangium violaceum]
MRVGCGAVLGGFSHAACRGRLRPPGRLKDKVAIVTGGATLIGARVLRAVMGPEQAEPAIPKLM